MRLYTSRQVRERRGEGRGGVGRRREGGKDDIPSGESLTDVATGCELRVVEDNRGVDGGGWGVVSRKKEEKTLTSTLQYTSVLPRRESTMTA